MSQENLSQPTQQLHHHQHQQEQHQITQQHQTNINNIPLVDQG